MPVLTLTSGYDNIPIGAYPSTFKLIEEIENEHGKAYRWHFLADDGKKISGVSDRESPPSPKNKTGRWLAALAKQSANDKLAVNTDDYIGRKYMVIVAAHGDKTRVDTFTAMWQ
jgi:hypothetical protein